MVLTRVTFDLVTAAEYLPVQASVPALHSTLKNVRTFGTQDTALRPFQEGCQACNYRAQHDPIRCLCSMRAANWETALQRSSKMLTYERSTVEGPAKLQAIAHRRHKLGMLGNEVGCLADGVEAPTASRWLSGVSQKELDAATDCLPAVMASSTGQPSDCSLKVKHCVFIASQDSLVLMLDCCG